MKYALNVSLNRKKKEESGYLPEEFKHVSFRNIGIVIVIILIAYTALLYLLLEVEKDHPDANIQDMFDAVWWSIVTITTVGFGDTYPVTDGGRIIGFVFLLVSLSFYAILIGRITNLITTILTNRKMGFYGMKEKGHAVIIGWDNFGKLVTNQLVAAGKKVAIVTKEKDDIDHIRGSFSSNQVFTLFSDLAKVEILDKVNISDSSVVFLNLDDDTEKLVMILHIKKMFENVKFIVAIDNADLKETFKSAGVTYVISKNGLAAKLLASYIFEPDVASYNEEIISYAQTDDHYDMKEFNVIQTNPYLGQAYNKVFFDLKKETNAILVGVAKSKNGKRELIKNPEEEVLVEENDYLLMIVNRKAERKLIKLFGTTEGLSE